MDSTLENFGNNSVEDLRWLCNLSESELDMLIRLKLLIMQRAKVLGHSKLAEKIDMRSLLAIGLVLMEYLKGKVKDLSHIPGLTNSAVLEGSFNLLKRNPGDSLSMEELKAYISIDKRKKTAKRPREEAAGE